MTARSDSARQRSLAAILLLGIMTGAGACGRMSGPTPTADATQKQPFIVDPVVDTLHAVSRVLNRPQKYKLNPIFKSEKPWEGNLVGLTSVIYDDDEQTFKMWYSARKITAQRPPGPIEKV